MPVWRNASWSISPRPLVGVRLLKYPTATWLPCHLLSTAVSTQNQIAGLHAGDTPAWIAFIVKGPLVTGGTYRASALRLTGAIQKYIPPRPPPPNFWEKAKGMGKTLQDYVRRLLRSAADYFMSTSFTDITTAMNGIVHATATFRERIQSSLDARNITLPALTKELEGIFTRIVRDMHKISSLDKVPGHVERESMVERLLDDTEVALVDLAARMGIGPEAVTAYLRAVRPHVHALTVAVGDVNEKYPRLFPTLTFCVAVMLIPEEWLLKPFLSMFGFGPEGPAKGSAAAWLQRAFWGGAVRAGSWFSLLQAAGMGIIPVWAGFVVKSPLIIGGLLKSFIPFFKRRK